MPNSKRHVLLVILILLLAPAVWNLAASRYQHARNPVPGALYDVEGRQMHIYCTGTGPYTDRKSTRLNSSHANISYAVFCLKKKKHNEHTSHSCTMCTHTPRNRRHTRHN